MNFTKTQIERILEFKFVFSFLGNNPSLQGRTEAGVGGGGVKKFTAIVAAGFEVVPLK